MSVLTPITFEPVRLPLVPQKRPGRKRDSKLMGLAAIFEPDGSLAYQEDSWAFNGVHDAGELYFLQRAFTSQALETFHISLINDASIAETDGTMSAVTESKTPGTGGYDRQATALTTDGLIGGDHRFSATEETFGAITTAVLTATHAALCTTATGAGLLLATLALQATTTVAIGQFFKYIYRQTAS